MSGGKRLYHAMGRNRVARFAYRARNVWQSRETSRGRYRESLRYLLRGQQLSNFYYENRNEGDAVAMISAVLGQPPASVRQLFEELRGDRAFIDHLRAGLAGREFREPEPRFGYRLALYALVRIVCPSRILEVGAHDGLGSAVMVRALERNAEDGRLGRLTWCDQDPGAGWLIPPARNVAVDALVGDAMATVPRALETGGIDLMVDDIGANFPGKAELIGLAERAKVPYVFLEPDPDDALREATQRAGGRYAEFEEDARELFYPGGTFALGSLVEPEPS